MSRQKKNNIPDSELKDYLGTVLKARVTINKIWYISEEKDTGLYWQIFPATITKTYYGEIDKFSSINHTVTFCGDAPDLSGGFDYIVCAELVYNDKYGFQYQIRSISEYVSLETQEEQYKFFSMFLSNAQIDKLFKASPDPISLLEKEDVESLTAVSGIGPSTAQKIIEKYQESIDKTEVYSQLYDWGLTKNMIDKIVLAYKSAQVAIKAINANPYELIEKVNGISWTKADAIGKARGIASDSIERITAYFLYYFHTLANDEGHIWVDLDDLVFAVREIAPSVTDDRIRECLNIGLDKEILFYDRPTRRIGLLAYRKLEEKIAEEVVRLNNQESPKIEFIEETIAECEQELGIEYTDEQKEAIHGIFNNNIVLVTGKAGCGKSFIMYPVIKIFRKNNLDVESIALAGKASLNLSQITGEEGKTIHRCLGWVPELNGFTYNKKHKKSTDVFILDEISMVGGSLFYDLCSAMKNKARLIMIGDDHQLEAIGLCNLLVDFKKSGLIKCYNLTKIHRQAQRSGIIIDSAMISNGRTPILPDVTQPTVHGELRDMAYYPEENNDSIRVRVLSLFNQWHFDQHIPLDQIAVCCTKRSIGSLSCQSLNEAIQQLILPELGPECAIMNYKDGTQEYTIRFHVGDKIRITKNCYNTKNEKGQKEPVFNGNLGVIVGTLPGKNSLIVKFLQGTIIIPQRQYINMQLGYVITTHSAQGSGFPYVIGVCDGSAYTLNTKELFYTMVTRAKTYCALVYAPLVLLRAIKTSRVVKKQTWLAEILNETQKKYQENPETYLTNWDKSDIINTSDEDLAYQTEFDNTEDTDWSNAWSPEDEDLPF